MVKRKTIRNFPYTLLIAAMTLAWLNYQQMRYHFLSFLPIGHSDLVGFYVTRFPDNISHWPYQTYTLATNGNQVGPIEYPVLTGLIVWLTTFITPKSGEIRINYFLLNSLLLALLFVISTYILSKIASRKASWLFICSPAVVLSLFLNWDLWAVVPMLLAIFFFENNRLRSSAICLGLSVAAKFFPIVLLIPISIFFYRQKQYRALVKYILDFVITWLCINLPIMLIDYSGWSYFYRFSAERIIGDGSIFNIFAKWNVVNQIPMWIYYLLNIALFAALIVFFFRSKKPISISLGAFLAVFAFTYFGKQYSMQYVLWLTPLALVGISKLGRKEQKPVFRAFIAWQVGEFLIHFAYFKNMIQEMSNPIYGIFASILEINLSR